MAVLRWHCCQSRWRGLSGSVAQSLLDTDSPQCLKIDSLRRIGTFIYFFLRSKWFCNVFNIAAHASPRASKVIFHSCKKTPKKQTNKKLAMVQEKQNFFYRPAAAAQRGRIRSTSSWESFSISQVVHCIFSATTNSRLVLFILLA